MKCRRCNNEIDHLWNDMWELCGECGFRYNVEFQYSPDGPEKSQEESSV